MRNEADRRVEQREQDVVGSQDTVLGAAFDLRNPAVSTLQKDFQSIRTIKKLGFGKESDY